MRTIRYSALKFAVVAAILGAFIACGVDMAGAEPGFTPIQLMPAPSGIASSAIGYGSISCPTSSWCAATGDGVSGAPFVATQTSGVWGVPQRIPLPSGGVGGRLGLTCPSASYCLAAGTYETSARSTLPLLASEASGTWGAAASFALPVGAATGASAWSLIVAPWCASVGNCEVVGTYEISLYDYRFFVRTEISGTWGVATALPGGAVHPYLASFSCTSIGNCSAVAGRDAWIESSGSWTPTGVPIAPAGESFDASAIACPNATTCITVGYVVNDNGISSQPNAAAATETDGTWGSVESLPVPQLSPLPVSTEFSQITCHAAECVAVGDGGSFNLHSAYQSPIAATWIGGSWSSIGMERLLLPKADDRDGSHLNDVSCPTATQCVAVGEYEVYGPHQIISDVLSPFSTALLPVRPTVAPAPPIYVTARPRIAGAIVGWAPPVDDGGAPIATYTATVSPGGESCITSDHVCRVTGLTNGRQYVITITDTNGTFTSRRAFSNHFFAGQIPSAPSKLHVRVTAYGVTVSWVRSSSPAGEPVLRYEVRAERGDKVATCIAQGNACTYHQTLPRGAYAISVSALNVTGWSRPAEVRIAIR